jgi:hypothetical protein
VDRVVVAVLAAALVAVVVLARRALRGRQGRVDRLRGIRIVLAPDQKEGAAIAHSIACVNAASRRARATRHQLLAEAAERLGWDVRVASVDALKVPVHDGSDDPFGTARRAISDGGVLTLIPPRGAPKESVPVSSARGVLSWSSHTSSVMARDKFRCSRWLRGHGIPVPDSLDVRLCAASLERFACDRTASLAVRAVLASLGGHVEGLIARHGSAVVKPLSGTGGAWVTTGIEDAGTLALVLAQSCRRSGIERWLVEQHLRGRSYRVLVACPPSGAPPRMICVCERVVPFVVGDGVSTLARLVEDDARRRTAWHPHAPTMVGRWLRGRGIEPDAVVPEAGAAVRISDATNWGRGAPHWRVDPAALGLHPDNERIFCAAARSLPGVPFLVALDVIGDMTIPGGAVVHDVEPQSGIDDIPGGCDWVPADASRLFDDMLLAYVAPSSGRANG